MAGAPTQFGNSDFHGNSLSNTKRKLIIRTMGATLIIALVALIASQQATSSPDTEAQKNHSQVQLDVVHDTTNSASSSDIKSIGNDVSETTLNTSRDGNASASADTSVNVTVNGQSINVPSNGSSQQTIATPGGETKVNISHNNDASGTSLETSFTSVNQNASVNSSFNSTSRTYSSSYNRSWGGSE